MITETLKNWVFKVDDKYNLGLCKAMGIDNSEQHQEIPEPESTTLHCTFRLPITYLPENKIRPLSKVVSADLELLSSYEQYETRSLQFLQTSDFPEHDSIYDYLLKPKHQFARNLIPDWNRYFTTYAPFLEDSQQMIYHMSHYLERMNCTFYPSDGDPIGCPKLKDPLYEFTEEKCNKIMDIWSDIKEDPNFLENYGYIEWEYFAYLNQSPAFLQSLSIMNMSSPIMSFLIPIIFLIFPFIILKIQGIPITFNMYIQVLKDIARYHFIGKTISSIQKLSWDKLIYLIITIGLYGLQIYQNITTCYRFYRNISMINEHLLDLRDFLEYSMRSTDIFIDINKSLQTYSEFNETTVKYRTKIGHLYELLKSIKPFQPGLSKIVEIGYLLRCFYEVHTNKEYEIAIRYAIGFEGYINNLSGIHENIISQKIAMSKFSDDSSTQMQELYYPPYVDKAHVKNNCDLSNNMIITGPNASGKTTLLKAVTINIIFTQQFGCGFYKSCTIYPYTHIHSYLNIPDTSGRDSLFQAESRRCKEIINIINSPFSSDASSSEVDSQQGGSAATAATAARHFCIFDELYSGTNPKEAAKSAYAFLLYLSKYKNVNYILTTHYVKLCKRLEKKLGKPNSKYRQITNYKMDVLENKKSNKVTRDIGEQSKEGIKYSYKMKPGISKVQGAILILEDMQYPKEILDEIRNKPTPYE